VLRKENVMPRWYFTTVNFACILFTSSVSIVALFGIPVVFYMTGLSLWSIGYTVMIIPCSFYLFREDWRDYHRDKERIGDLKPMPFFSQF
jgi:uncharacterized membrane protein